MTRLAVSMICICLSFSVAVAADSNGDAQGRALYDQMVKTMREATTLHWESEYQWECDGRKIGHVWYRCWLKKPNQFRIEAGASGSDAANGVLVGDGENLWLYWPGEKPRYQWEESGAAAEQYEKTKRTSYMTSRTPVGRHSIGHEARFLTTGLDAMPILDPSTFHAYEDCLQPYINGVRTLGVEKVDSEECDVIDVSIMQGQRTWKLWLTKADHLPRKIEQVVHVVPSHKMVETWTNVACDIEIDDDKFKWSPPEGWTRWKMPENESGMLPPGTEAPDFDMASIDGQRIRLSDFRGKYVWMFCWRVGCPPCREEIDDVQALYERYRDKGLVVLGINTADTKEFVDKVIAQNKVTFPNILDTSEAGQEAVKRFETEGHGAVPMTYLIDREGKVMDAWYGDWPEKRAEALKRLGLE